MKIEKINKNKGIFFCYALILGVGLLITIYSIFSYAKYQGIEDIELVNGEINYKLPDFKMMAIYKQVGSEYEEISTMPGLGYKINETESYCTTNNVEKDQSAILKTIDGHHTIKNISKNSKCYLYFDTYCKKEDTACTKILANKEIKERESINAPLTENTTGSIYATLDNEGVSYYYAGSVDNNWLEFAGYYWRIIRINGDGTIRIIYNGPTTNQTGETTQIGVSAFNENYDDNAYVGYMYGTPNSNTYEETHANINDSTIKKVLDKWYQNSLQAYADKIDFNAGFCNDRSTILYAEYTALGYAKMPTYYGAFLRLVINREPTLECKSHDLFTSITAKKGNKKLTYPIGLITADEVTYAGGYDGQENSNYFLYTNMDYITMTPSFFRDIYFYAGNFHVYKNGGLGSDSINANIGVRPVINLKSNISLIGNGSKESPFIISAY